MPSNINRKKKKQRPQSQNASNGDKHKNTERFVIRDAVSTSTLCFKIREEGRRGKLKDVVLRRKSLDSALIGALQDLLLSQSSWRTIELRVGGDARAGILILRLLKAVHAMTIDKLILIEPTQPIISWMGTMLGNEENEFVTIHSLSLRSAHLSTASASSLCEGLRSKWCTVRRLDFSHSTLSKQQVAAVLGEGLKTCQSVQELCLSHCNLEDIEVRDLVEPLCGAHPTSLVNLSLDHNFCQEEGTMAVSKLLPSLQQLDLSNQNVWDGREYLDSLTTALQKPNCRLLELDLSSSFLLDFHFEALLEALQHNTTLQKINLRNNRITDDGLIVLAKSLPKLHLRSMDLEQNSFSNAACLEAGLASNVLMTSLCVESPTVKLMYYLALNKGGRAAKQPNEISLQLWPLVLARSGRCLTGRQEYMGIRSEDIVFDLLHGPVLLER